MDVSSSHIILPNAPCTSSKHSETTSDSLEPKLDNDSKVSKGNNGIPSVNENPAGLHHQDDPTKEDSELTAKSAFELLSTLLKKDSTKFVPGRNRRKEKLAYHMHEIEESEKKCSLCGPPFLELTSSDLLGLSVCSYNCVKRFVNEVLAKPKGFQVKQGKTKPEKDGRPSVPLWRRY